MYNLIPSFTVLITTYNRLEFLERAIDSALAQTLPCQVVVVDDCSTDGTESYMQQRVKALSQKVNSRLVYHRNSTNQGHAQSVNIGVEIAQGDWIKFLDDDDYLAENCLEVIAQAIAECPYAVICSVQAAQVDFDGNEQRRTQPCGWGQAFYIPLEDIHYGMLLEQVPFGTPVQVAVKREAFLRSGGWKSGLDMNFDDIESWLNIARFGDAVFIQQCLADRMIWSGAYNCHLSLQKRLENHILIKTKIYDLVSDRYRHQLPNLTSVIAYLKLYWGLIALKQGQLKAALNMLFPSFFSIRGWRLFQKVIAFRHNPSAVSEVRKIPLTNLPNYQVFSVKTLSQFQEIDKAAPSFLH